MSGKDQARNLKEHQEVLFNMLKVIDEVCQRHGIRYMLFGGSALGAVREKGFIPWDDDMDVIMLRPDYERFLKLAPGDLGEDYFLQKEFSKHWPCPFSKLRKNGTACIERFIPKDPLIHQGIYVDIFPADNLSDHALVRAVQFAASKIVIAKSLWERGYLTNSLAKKAFIQFSRLFDKEKTARLVRLEGSPQSQRVHTFFAASKAYSKSVFPRSWFSSVRFVPFQGQDFPVSTQAEKMLTVLYGDFRIPTPPEKREIKVHAEIVDTQHSYTEYQGVQKGMIFTQYTRSIR